jgi:hypothetical protein
VPAAGQDDQVVPDAFLDARAGHLVKRPGVAQAVYQSLQARGGVVLDGNVKHCGFWIVDCEFKKAEIYPQITQIYAD